MKFTQRTIEDLECEPGKKDTLAFDSGKDSQRGLGVRVTSGARKGSLDHKSFVVQYRHGGLKRRIPLGACSAVTLADARKAAAATMGRVAQGGDPAAERKAKELEARAKALEAKREALTLGALIDQWEKLHLTGRRPNYSAAAASALRRSFAKLLDAPAASLGRATVVRVLDRVAKDGKAAMAGATARYGSALFGWAVRRGSISVNPFERVPTAPTVKRERVLSDDEIRRVWKATEGPGAFNAIVRALLLTGQRREEVSGLTWSELDPGFSVWTLPAARSKNGKPHVVPLSAQMRTLLRVQPQLAETELVFPGERGAFSGWSKSKARLDRRSSVSGWRLHDLRRTASTGLQKLGVRLEVNEAVLNHLSGSRGGVAGIYQRHEWAEEKSAALNAWGERVAAIVEGRAAADNITPIRRSA
jgi:integrase